MSRWTRTDQTGKYTVHREPGAVGDPTLVQLKVNGAEVVVETLSSPDGKSCRFEGRIGAGGRSITGLMHCPGADAVGWTAEVRCRAFDPCSDPRGMAAIDRWLKEALPPQQPGSPCATTCGAG